jgi:hypothetical protein
LQPAPLSSATVPSRSVLSMVHRHLRSSRCRPRSSQTSPSLFFVLSVLCRVTGRRRQRQASLMCVLSVLRCVLDCRCRPRSLQTGLAHLCTVRVAMCSRLPLPLQDAVVADKYGAKLDIPFLGKFANRYTYVISPEGTVEKVRAPPQSRITRSGLRHCDVRRPDSARFDIAWKTWGELCTRAFGWSCHLQQRSNSRRNARRSHAAPPAVEVSHSTLCHLAARFGSALTPPLPPLLFNLHSICSLYPISVPVLPRCSRTWSRTSPPTARRCWPTCSPGSRPGARSSNLKLK